MGARDVQIRIVAFDQASSAFRQIEDAAARATRQMQNMGNNSTGAVYNAAGVAAGIMAYNALASAASAAMNMTLNFSKTMETNEIGIAGILMSMTTLNGETLKWGDAMSISKDVMRQLNDEALKTAATSEEMVGAFRGILAPGLAAKMTMKEIVELTSVGVNAVKSFNLPKQQILQELRDLVQGGITPASSTLATSMGLKDADIKAAKASSEGLFAFLMRRMEGFKYSAQATQLTMAGLTDTAIEGFTRIGSVGTLPVFNMIKENLQTIGKQFVDINNETGKVTISKNLTNELTQISTKAVKVANDLQELFLPVAEVAVPTLKVAGAAVAFVADNVVTVGRGLATWYVLSTIAGMYTKIAAVTSGAVVSNGLLGRAVAITTAEFSRQGAVAEIAIAKEMAMVEGASAAIIAAEKAKAVAKKEAAMLAAGILKAEEAGNLTLATQIRGLSAEYMRLGMTAEEAGLMQLQAANMARKGNFLLATQLIEVRAAHLASAVAAREAQIAATTGAGAAGNAVKSLGKTVLALAGGWLGVGIAAAWATTVMIDYWKKKNRVDSYNQKAEVFEGIDADGNKYYTKNVWVKGEMVNSGTGGMVQGVDHIERVKLSPAELERHLQYLKEKEDLENGISTEQKPPPDISGLEPKFPGATEIDKQGLKLAEQQERHEDKLRLMVDGLNEKIIGETGTNFQTNVAKTLKEIDKMNIEIREAKEKGVDTKEAEAKIKAYRETMLGNEDKDENKRTLGKYGKEQFWAQQELQNNTGIMDANTTNNERMAAEWTKQKSYTEANKARDDEYKQTGDSDAAEASRAAKNAAADRVYLDSIRDINLKEINQQIDKNNMLVQLEGKTYAEVDALNRQALQSKITMLDDEIKKATTTKEDRIKLEQQKMSAIESLQQISGRNLETAGAEAMRRIKAQQFDYAEVMVQSFNDIGSSIEGHLTGYLNRTESFSQSFQGIFSDMVKAVEQMMIKMWMQKTIMGPLQDWFSGILGSSTKTNTSAFTLSNGTQLDPNFGFKIPGKAKGGRGQGLTLVGEEGPELINFDNPGMVYTANQTKNIMGGGNQSPQVIVNVINNTDNKVKVSKKATFDSDTQMTVVTMVIDALERNVGGMKDAFQGGAG